VNINPFSVVSSVQPNAVAQDYALVSSPTVRPPTVLVSPVNNSPLGDIAWVESVYGGYNPFSPGGLPLGVVFPPAGGNAPAGDPPAGNGPVGDAPVGDAPAGDPPVGDAPVGDVPVGDAPVEDAPLEDGPVGDAPVGDAPVGELPAGDPQAGDPLIGNDGNGDDNQAALPADGGAIA
jgi:hypothetical protein